jgi:hypothetical protein
LIWAASAGVRSFVSLGIVGIAKRKPSNVEEPFDEKPFDLDFLDIAITG